MTRTYEKFNSGKFYTICAYSGKNNILTVTRKDGKSEITKTVKIKEEPSGLYNYTCKPQKTQIRAIGGAHGLYKFFDDELFNQGPLRSYVFRILDHIIDIMKEAPAGI